MKQCLPARNPSVTSYCILSLVSIDMWSVWGHDSDTGVSDLFVRAQTNGSRTYLLVVDNEWVDGKVRQRVLLRLGRLDELLASGRLDSLIQSLGRFSEKLAVLGAHARGDSITTRSARIGPALIFQRLWQACSIDKVLTTLLQGRRFEFSVERAIFLTVLHRLLAPGSDRAAEKWKD